jgi:A118 family predicted phage portal protein
MNLIAVIKGWFRMLFDGKAKEEFDVKPIPKTQTNAFIEECQNIYAGNPSWATEDVKTINFAKSVCTEVARLVMQGTTIEIDGSARAEELQKRIDDAYTDIRRWVEYGCASGMAILKPNGDSIDVALPNEFIITETDGNKIRGCVFLNTQYDDERYYHRLEYHHFQDDGKYAISNRCYVSKSADSIGNPIDIDATPWAGMLEDVESDNIDRMLFGVLKMPNANNIEPSSPYGLPIFADAVQELEDLDVAYSRNSKEIFDSKRTVLLDSDRLMPSGTKLGDYDTRKTAAGLPDYVKIVEGMGDKDIYHEINPTLNTDTRLVGLNNLLSQIGYKCGFSNGYFVFNQKSGVVTATQVESEDRRTLQLIKDIRDQLEKCLDDLIYALDKFLDNDGYPVGKYEVTYDFGDLTYNREEDRQRWWGYVVAGAVPKWMYFNKFEGMSEEDAKKMVDEAQPKDQLFAQMEEE